MQRLSRCFIIPMTLLALVACSSASPPALPTTVPQPTEPPATALPTVVPQPTASPSATLPPTPAPTTLTLQPVVIGELTTYTYTTGLFSIGIPADWRITDNSRPGEAIVLWTDPTENGLIVVDVFQERQQQSEAELVQFLEDYLQDAFQSEPDFRLNEPIPQTDGSVLIVWSYTAEASGGITTPLLGNSFIEQRDDKVSLLTTVVPEAQFETLRPATDTILNSYQLEPSAALP
ncbi:MAG TPA: hypothetical protein VJG32_04505 [Anaerolineae bacterium]|nr:hypothetical protein [Anaerolineae bacterium]